MARKKPSAKQLAARRKFSAIMKSGGFRKRKRTSTKRRSAPKRRISRTRTRVITKIRRVRSMVKRRTSSRRSSGLIPPKVKSIGTKIAIGAGAGAALSLVGGLVGRPDIGRNGLIGAAAAFLLGGPIAGGAALLIGGGLSAITGQGGNGSSFNQMEGSA